MWSEKISNISDIFSAWRIQLVPFQDPSKKRRDVHFMIFIKSEGANEQVRGKRNTERLRYIFRTNLRPMYFEEKKDVI